MRTHPHPPVLVLLGLAACGAPTDSLYGDRQAVERGELDLAAADRSGAPFQLVLAGGAEEWGDRDVPWELRGAGAAEADEVCIGTHPRRCTNWQPAAFLGEWRAPAAPGDHTVLAWVRELGEQPQGPALATVYVDASAPRSGRVTTTAVEAGLSLSWSSFVDTGVGIDHYMVTIGEGVAVPNCRNPDNAVWTGAEKSTTILGLTADLHTVRVCAVDGLGNISIGKLGRGTPLGDPTPPEVDSFSIADQARAVGSRDTVLTGVVTDSSGVVEFCASETASTVDDCPVWRDWEDGVAWELSSDEGEKALSVWFRDRYGNISDAASDTVVLDRSRPQNGELSLSAGAGSVELEWSGFTDEYSPINEYIVVSDDTWAPDSCEEGTERYRGSATSLTVEDLAGGAYVGFRVCAVDELGHISTGVNARTYVTTEVDPPEVTSFVLNEGEPVAWQRRVDVAVSGTDASGISRMCMSTTSELCYAWEAYANTADVLLPTTEGSYTVYLWLEDSLGQRTETPTSATISWRTPRDEDEDGVDERTDCDDTDPDVAPGLEEVCGNGVDDDCDTKVDKDVECFCDAEDWEGTTLYFCKERHTHDDAIELCEAEGLLLASIATAEQNQWVVDTALSYGMTNSWIGFNDVEEEGTWVWADGSDVTYTNWNRGEPNDWGSGEDWAQFYTSGTWNDMLPNARMNYVCQDGELRTWYLDEDGDGYGTADEVYVSVHPPEHAVLEDGDCDDEDADTAPDVLERCNGVDDNCDGDIDEGCGG